MCRVALTRLAIRQRTHHRHRFYSTRPGAAGLDSRTPAGARIGDPRASNGCLGGKPMQAVHEEWRVLRHTKAREQRWSLMERPALAATLRFRIANRGVPVAKPTPTRGFRPGVS